MNLPVAPNAQQASLWGWLSVFSGCFGGILFVWVVIAIGFWIGWLAIGLTPVAAVMGIWNFRKARAAALASPEQYQTPDRLSFRLCIWGLAFYLPMVGIFVPAMLEQRKSTRDYYTRDVAVKAPLASLAEAYDAEAKPGVPAWELIGKLEETLRARPAQDPNAWDHAIPIVDSHIEVCSGLSPERLEAKARIRATRLGQGVFVVELPEEGKLGFIAGAARLKGVRFATDPTGAPIVSARVQIPAKP